MQKCIECEKEYYDEAFENGDRKNDTCHKCTIRILTEVQKSFRKNVKFFIERMINISDDFVNGTIFKQYYECKMDLYVQTILKHQHDITIMMFEIENLESRWKQYEQVAESDDIEK